MTDAYIEEYTKLVGKKVIKIAIDNETFDENTYGLVFDDNTIAWIVMDPECNGPGFLSIE